MVASITMRFSQCLLLLILFGLHVIVLMANGSSLFVVKVLDRKWCDRGEYFGVCVCQLSEVNNIHNLAQIKCILYTLFDRTQHVVCK